MDSNTSDTSACAHHHEADRPGIPLTGRPPGSDLGKAAINWTSAFTFYASFPPEQRSYERVAVEYGVSLRTVETHGRREQWRERARQIDREACAEAELRIGRARADQLVDIQRMVEASLVAYAEQLRNGTVRLTPADLPRLVKLLDDLWSEPAPVNTTDGVPMQTPPATPSLEHMAGVIAALQETNLFAAADDRGDHGDLR